MDEISSKFEYLSLEINLDRLKNFIANCTPLHVNFNGLLKNSSHVPTFDLEKRYTFDLDAFSDSESSTTKKKNPQILKKLPSFQRNGKKLFEAETRLLKTWANFFWGTNKVI